MSVDIVVWIPAILSISLGFIVRRSVYLWYSNGTLFDLPENMNLVWIPIGSIGLIFIVRRAILFWKSPLRSLPGPKSTSYIFGNLNEIFKADSCVLHEEWVKQYGKTFKYYGVAHTPRLFTMDPRALNHVLSHSEDYHKPEPARFSLAKVVGAGLLIAEGTKHRQQRRIMNPAFGIGHVRSLIPIFNQKSMELRDVLLSQISNEGSSSSQLDILSLLSRATLDIIGLAGFGYSFDTMTSETNELNSAFQTAYKSAQQLSILPMLQLWIPFLRRIRTQQDVQLADAQKVMRRIGLSLIDDCKTAFLNTEKSQYATRRDLLSLLVKANMEDRNGMSDEDVLSQVPTFIVAGHETTSTATTWALYSLSLNPEIQTKLRDELFTINTETPDMDELKSLSYLDAVVKEALRVHSPVPNTTRVAMKDDAIPLEDGTFVSIGKGDNVFIPIIAMNRATDVWGDDSFEFRPERWNSLPEQVRNMPGVWSHILSFLGGPRACIGYQFSIYEIKCLLFALLRTFEFSLAVPQESIGRRSRIVTRPFIKGEEEKGAQLPVIVKVYTQK